jgi:signal transduction histidine kinase
MRSLAADFARLGNVDARIGHKLDSSLRQSKRLIGLVDNLLDVTRITGGGVTLRRETFDLAQAVSDLVDRFIETAASAGVTLELQAETPAIGEWDRLRIEQIAENLIANAIKYAPNAPVTITVTSDDEAAWLAVRDQGPGIAAPDRARIFGPFERAVSARNYGGLGLGLYVAHQNVIAHGGTISVESELGAGATFIAELPKKSATA